MTPLAHYRHNKDAEVLSLCFRHAMLLRGCIQRITHLQAAGFSFCLAGKRLAKTVSSSGCGISSLSSSMLASRSRANASTMPWFSSLQRPHDSREVRVQ